MPSDPHSHHGHVHSSACAHAHGHGHGHGHAVASHPTPTQDVVTDPVCGMQMDPRTSPHRFSHGGALFHFCSASCLEKFATEPGRYLQAERTEPPAATAGTIYTCPMHPEIRQEGPGSCPICGMALEPLDVKAATGPSPELRDMTRRFWFGLALSLPVVVLEMGAHLPGLNLHHFIDARVSVWVQFALATPVVLWAGWPFFIRA